MEYLLVHRGGRGQSIVYELLYRGDMASNAPHLMGLIDAEHLKHRYDGKKSGAAPQTSGQTVKKTAPSQGQVSPKSGGSQAPVTAPQPTVNGASRPLVANSGHYGLPV